VNTIDEILNDFKKGHFVILVDDENRENEGDLVIAAEYITSDKINFLMKEARGLICLVLSAEQIDRLKLPMMRSDYHTQHHQQTAFTMSIDAKMGISTGISASDRARTIQLASSQDVQPDDLVCPGHVFPLKAHSQGVLGRPGHTEAGFDLARLANLKPAAVICEIINDDGSVAKMKDLTEFAQKYQIKIGSIADLIQYRIDITEKSRKNDL